jgi:hypothetical protein
LTAQVDRIWNELQAKGCSKRFTVRWGEMMRLSCRVEAKYTPTIVGGEAPTYAWMVTDSDKEADFGHGYSMRQNVACPPTKVADPDDPAMEEIDVSTMRPPVPTRTVEAPAEDANTMPVAAGTVIQEGPQAATTDRGQADMDTTEPTAASGVGDGNNNPDGVDFSA